MPNEALQADRRRKTRREIDLDRDDLFFLLESYKNMIELNTTLLERQEVLNKGIENILTEAAKICANQNAIAANIAKIPDQIQVLIDTLCAATVERYEEIKNELKSNRKEENDEHHSHTLRIYAVYGILASIVITLIGLIAKLWPKI